MTHPGAPAGGFNPPAGFPGQGMQQQAQQQQRGMNIPQRGAFALSEVLPQLQQASALMDEARAEWTSRREEANRAEAHSKKTRADFLIKLRVFGNDALGGIPIKTAAERKEWADADSAVQQAELEADLAQTVQMSAKEAYESAKSKFEALRSALSMEKELMSREWSGPHVGP